MGMWSDNEILTIFRIWLLTGVYLNCESLLNRDIAYYYWLDLSEMSIPEVMAVDILWEGGVTMKF